MRADWTGALERARKHAPFLTRGLEKHAELAELLENGEGDIALSRAKAASEGIEDTGLALRRVLRVFD